jgi:hypothetical protein
MANIQPTRFTTGDDGRKRAARDTKWIVRYRTPDGASRMKTFRLKSEAERFAATVEVDKARCVYRPERGAGDVRRVRGNVATGAGTSREHV